MDVNTNRAYLEAAGLGAIAGMRSMAAPALLSRRLSERRWARPGSFPERLLSSDTAAKVFTALGAGEMIADKVPGMPNRTAPPGLLGRALSGALVGAAAATAQRERGAVGAAIGASAAVAATFASFHLRQLMDRKLHLPDALVGAVEDAAVIGGGKKLVDGVRTRRFALG